MWKHQGQRGSQILGAAKQSLFPQEVSSIWEKHGGRGSSVGTPTAGTAPAQAVPLPRPPVAPTPPETHHPEPVPVQRRNSDSTGTQVSGKKPWEEPSPERPQSATRKTSTVRLPGLLLNDEEDEEQNLEKELRSKELISYLQDKWNLETTDKSSLVEINYRTVEMLKHKEPTNHWLLKRARQKIAENTGFFSNVTKPYEFLGVPEMNNDMIIFRNLPDYLKVTPDEWNEVQLRREKENSKLNARLPHLPHLKSRGTKYARGRIKQGAGGMSHVERLIRNGEGFQREIRGTPTFTKVLERWFENIESENANRGSPFGPVMRTKVEKTAEVMPDLTGSTKSGYERDDNGRLVTTVDEKVYEEFQNLEKMITAIYNLVKSMINVKLKQLKSANRIPFSGVMELRSGTAGRQAVRRKPVDLLGKFNKNTGFYSALSRGVTGKSNNSSGEDAREGSTESSVRDAETTEFEQRLKENKQRYSMLQFHGSGRSVPRSFNPISVGEAYPLSPTGSAEDVKVAVERIKNIVESECYLDDRPYELRSGTLRKERSIPQAERNRKHFDRFHAMFLRHHKVPEPLWWNVHTRGLKKSETEIDQECGEVEAGPLNSHGSYSKFDTSLPGTTKIPEPDGILTPKLPGPPSREELNSEEQSRLNLLSIVPDSAAATNQRPSSPVAKLYEAAGVKTLEKDLFQIMMSVKRPFRGLEKSLRVNLTNKMEKFEWDSSKRYKAKIQADCSGPIYEKAVGNMRFLAKLAEKREIRAIEDNVGDPGAEKQPARWFRDLIELCDRIGALKHHGCSTIVHKLVRFCDVHSNSKPYMLRRFCLLVVSLPGNELASPHFQKAIAFLLDRLFGAPAELLPEWIHYRGLKPLISC